MHDQEGFPLELTQLLCSGTSLAIDWCEAMADASTSNNLPTLVKQMETMFPETEVARIKQSFVRLIDTGKTYEDILKEKRR